MARGDSIPIGWVMAGIGTAVLIAGAGTVVAYSGGKPIGTIKLTRVDGFDVEVQTAKQFLAMKAAAARDGITLRITSAFRPIEKQASLYATYAIALANFTKGLISSKPAPVAKPGYSNHGSGTALDISVEGNDPNSRTYKWLAANAATYGFKNTGASYSVKEWWHWERIKIVNVDPKPRLAGLSRYPRHALRA